MNKIRVAVVGAGHLGRIHARLIGTLPQYQLVAVVDPVASSREQAAAEFATRPLADYRELIGQVDAAVVAAPTKFHHAIGLDLLRAGVHLLVEKPLASNHAQAEQLAAEARTHQRVLQVGHVERFNPAWSAALPHLVEPKYIEAVRRGPMSFRSTDVGVVLDLMIHDIDLVLSIVGAEVTRVEALGVALFGRHEDLATARLVFANGCVASLSASRASHAPARAMNIWCRRAFAHVDFAAKSASVVRPSEMLLERKFDIEALSAEQRLAWKDRLLPEHLPVESLAIEPRDAITAELEDFADSIQRARAPRIGGQQAAHALGVADRVLASLAEHAWDGTSTGGVGPLAAPQPTAVPSPHFVGQPATWRQAG